jgi:NAD+ kinase
MTIKRVAFVLHPAKREAAAMRDELAGFLQANQVDVAASSDRVDLVVAMGGDGTMLRAAVAAHAADALLLGVNFGALGYLTEVEAGAARAALEKVLAGSFHVEQRMLLACEVRTGDAVEHHIGLNEVLVERTARHRLVRLSVKISGQQLATFNADGVIVATPTGSTAYALSAGGPIISPRAEALVVVPISPHMIFSRPVVLAPDEVVEMYVDSSTPVASMSLDGALGCNLDPGAHVIARRAERSLRLVRLSGPDFLVRLRRKLSLPE